MSSSKKQKSIDSFGLKEKTKEHLDWSLARFIQKNKKKPRLYSKYGITENFSTNNLYIHFIKSDKQAVFKSIDGFLKFEEKIPFWYAIRNRNYIYDFIKENFGGWQEYFRTTFKNPFSEMSTVKLWNVSIVGSLVFGMFLMTFIYRYLDQGASAGVSKQLANQPPVEIARVINKPAGKVLGATATADVSKSKNISYQEQQKLAKQLKFQKEIKKIVKGYPIEKMAPYMAKQDKEVVAFLIGIAKQESGWGTHVPHYHGQDCYNYWGFRRKREKMGSGGHTCFNSPQDAVETVSSRIKYLIDKKNINTARKMVVIWKCGYDCSQDNPQAVRRWIDTVNMYFTKTKSLPE